MTSKPPLIAHVIYRLDVGGLENGVVNLINHMDISRYRHVIICATEATDFVHRIERRDVKVYSLNKSDGNDFKAQVKLWTLLRKLKPEIVHTRNMGTIEYVIPALLAGVKRRVHGEHGRNMLDIDGRNRKYKILRRFYALFINQFIAMSKDLEKWLSDEVGISQKKITQLYNGVDLDKFSASATNKRSEFGLDERDFLIGTVGRLQGEKDQSTLIRAFSLLVQDSSIKTSVKLLIVGDGPDRHMLESLALELGLQDHILFLGERNDVPQLLGMLDLFVLPSLGEGISNTILEAMACSRPVVATHVGGNPELVRDGMTGYLVPPANEMTMAAAIKRYLESPSLVMAHGKEGRRVVEECFSIQAMVARYLDAYDAVMHC